MNLPRLTAATIALTLLALGLACSGGGAGPRSETTQENPDPAEPSGPEPGGDVTDAPQDTDASGPAEATTASPDAEPSNEVSGAVQSLQGDVLRVRLGADDETPAPGTAVQLQRRHLENLFGADIEVSLNIGTAVIRERSGDVVVLEQLNKQSTITVDGEERDQFTEGAQVFIAW